MAARNKKKWLICGYNFLLYSFDGTLIHIHAYFRCASWSSGCWSVRVWCCLRRQMPIILWQHFTMPINKYLLLIWYAVLVVHYLNWSDYPNESRGIECNLSGQMLCVSCWAKEKSEKKLGNCFEMFIRVSGKNVCTAKLWKQKTN